MNGDPPTGGIATPDAHDAAPLAAPAPAPAQTQPSSSPTYQPLDTHPYVSSRSSYSAAPSYIPPVPSQRPRGGVHWGVWVLGGLLGILLLGMTGIVVVAALLGGLMAGAGQNEQTTVTTKTFAVSGMPSLVVTDAAGNVRIQPGSGDHVVVQVTKHAWAGSTSVARRGLSTVAVNLTQSSDVITVQAQFPTNVFDGGMTRRTVDLLITTPAQVNVDVNLGAGNLEARQLSGAIKLVSGAGTITLGGVTFAQSSLVNTGAGNITGECAIASGADVRMQIGAGNATLTMPADTPAHLVASTGIGNMTITGWSMPMMSQGAGHHMSGDMVPNPTAHLTVQVGTGNLTMMSH